MTDYSELKRLAAAARPGPWSAEGDELYWLEDGYTKHLMETYEGSDLCHDAEHPANLRFIAAANPAAVLALIAENEQLVDQLCICPTCHGQGEMFAGSYTHQGEWQPPEPDMDKCSECDGDGFIGTADDLAAVMAERDQLKAEIAGLKTGYAAYEEEVKGLRGEIEAMRKDKSEPCDGCFMVEAEALRKDAARLDRLEMECEAYGTDVHEGNRWVVDGPFATVRDAIDAGMSKEASHD
jgi:hypothetical protein